MEERSQCFNAHTYNGCGSFADRYYMYMHARTYKHNAHGSHRLSDTKIIFLYFVEPISFIWFQKYITRLLSCVNTTDV